MSDLPRFCLSSWVWVTVLISFDPPTGLSTEQAPDLLLTLVLSVIQEIAEGFPDGAVVKSLLQCRRRQRCRFASWVRKIPWSRKWQPAPIFLPGKHHVQRSLAGYSPWGCKELGTPKHAHTHTRTRTHTRARTHTHTHKNQLRKPWPLEFIWNTWIIHHLQWKPPNPCSPFVQWCWRHNVILNISASLLLKLQV